MAKSVNSLLQPVRFKRRVADVRTAPAGNAHMLGDDNGLAFYGSKPYSPSGEHTPETL